jgi:hypothetical protein
LTDSAGVAGFAGPGLAPDELEALTIPGKFYRALQALPQVHPADLEEAAFHVHALQRIVMQRAAMRAHPDRIPVKTPPSN